MGNVVETLDALDNFGLWTRWVATGPASAFYPAGSVPSALELVAMGDHADVLRTALNLDNTLHDITRLQLTLLCMWSLNRNHGTMQEWMNMFTFYKQIGTPLP